MADKKKAGSKLLAALGRTKKEQMGKLIPKGAKVKSYPKVKGDIRGKGPYLRGKVMGAGDFEARRKVLRGDAQKALRTADKEALGALATTAVAGATGYAIGKGWHKKLAGAVTPKKKDTHLDKARRGAKELIKKQKSKKKKSLKEIFKNKDTMREAFGPRIRKKNPHGYRGG
jgi:hypothetical protein